MNLQSANVICKIGVFPPASGRKFWLWRAVDQEGIVLEEILQSKRHKRAAKRLLKALIKRFSLPKRIVTDKLRSYGAARREIASGLTFR